MNKTLSITPYYLFDKKANEKIVLKLKLLSRSHNPIWIIPNDLPLVTDEGGKMITTDFQDFFSISRNKLTSLDEDFLPLFETLTDIVIKSEVDDVKAILLPSYLEDNTWGATTSFFYDDSFNFKEVDSGQNLTVTLDCLPKEELNKSQNQETLIYFLKCLLLSVGKSNNYGFVAINDFHDEVHLKNIFEMDSLEFYYKHNTQLKQDVFFKFYFNYVNKLFREDTDMHYESVFIHPSFNSLTSPVVYERKKHSNAKEELIYAEKLKWLIETKFLINKLYLTDLTKDNNNLIEEVKEQLLITNITLNKETNEKIDISYNLSKLLGERKYITPFFSGLQEELFKKFYTNNSNDLLNINSAMNYIIKDLLKQFNFETYSMVSYSKIKNELGL